MGRPRHPARRGPRTAHRTGPLHRRPAGRALGAFCPQPVRRRQDRKDQSARRRAGGHRRRSRGRKANPADAAQVQLQADRASRAGRRRRALRRRAGRRSGGGKRGRSRGHRRPSRYRDRADDADDRRDGGAGTRHTANSRGSARQRHPRRQGEDRRLRCGLGRRAQTRRASRCVRTGRTRRRWRRARRTPPTIPPAAASRSPAPRRCRISCAPPSPTCSACRRATCASSRPTSAAASARKCRSAPNTSCVVWLARKLKSAVAWTEDRRENLIASFHSRDQYITLEGAFDSNAKLLALRTDIISNVGAYSCFPTTSGVEPLMAMAEMPGPYDVRQYQCHARGVLTNTCTMAAYRGVSRPIITLTLERLMDKAAAAFGIDPVDIRRRNLIDKFPYTSATGLVYDEASYKETLEMAVEAIDLPAFRARQKEARKQGPSSRHRLCHLLRAHRLRQPGFRRARHGDHARLGDRHPHRRPVRLRRGAHRLLAARPGPAHHAGADHRRRDRRDARAHQNRARRHRPRALRLGHIRQPLAGDFRRRHADRGAEGARQADQDRKPHARSGARRHRAGRRRCQGRRHRPQRCRSRRWRARPIRKRTASTARSSRA